MRIASLVRNSLVRRTARAGLDSAVWFLAVVVAYLLRHDLQIDEVLVPETFVVGIVAAIGHGVVGFFIGPYHIGHQLGSFDEALDLGRTLAITTAGLTLWAALSDGLLLPRTVPVIAGVFALSGMLAWRLAMRSMRNRRAVGRRQKTRVVVFGAGEAGRRLLRSMMRDADSDFTPVALLDDDRAKRHLTIDGVKVRGTRHDISAVAAELNASAVVVALPQASASLVREVTALATGLDVLVLPALSDVMTERASSRDLHRVNVEDLLGRRPVKLDTASLSQQITGKSILVTGAGGSIGAELCRQISRFGPARLYLLDRDESGLLDTQLSLTGQGLLQGDEVILADIRDADALDAILERLRPEVVFHAAALKHLPLLENFPLEAWKSNVLGTLNVLRAAAKCDVGLFVNISTDKAADASCVLGFSKRIAERLTSGYAARESGRYVSVRFGNVLGSRGSVVQTFAAQIERGGPITITHPNVERFFMLIPEACQLVLEAGAVGLDGEVLVLDMGEPVRIVDVASTMIRMSGRRDVEIHFTGLRPGEKLSEDLVSTSEGRLQSSNPLIDRVIVPALDGDEVLALNPDSHEESRAMMVSLCANESDRT